MQNYFNDFIERYPQIYIQQNFDFKKHTTIGIGGYAPLAVFPKNYTELQQCLQYCLQHFVPYYPIGKGSNILVADTGVRGIVILLHNMQTVQLKQNTVYVEAGLSLGQLVQFAKAHCLAGYAALLGFPATVGGAIYMNAGVQEGHIGDLVQEVYAVDNKGDLLTFDRESCQFAYKQTVFMQNKAVIVAALLRADKENFAVIEEQIAKRKLARQYLPKERSMGCVFKNFEDVSAGELLDLAGCKGMQVGGAKISDRHANFIINTGNATAKDVLQLIAKMKESVYTLFKRQLKEEIEYIGEF